MPTWVFGDLSSWSLDLLSKRPLAGSFVRELDEHNLTRRTLGQFGKRPNGQKLNRPLDQVSHCPSQQASKSASAQEPNSAFGQLPTYRITARPKTGKFPFAQNDKTASAQVTAWALAQWALYRGWIEELIRDSWQDANCAVA
jgi:hypothetical protein